MTTLNEAPEWCPVRIQWAASLTPRQAGHQQFRAMDLSEPHNVITVRCLRGRGHAGDDVFSIADEIVRRARLSNGSR